MAKPLLQIIIGSTRPGRTGLPIGRWFDNVAHDEGSFDVEVADLAEINLPMFDEPKPPIMDGYQHPHTVAWAGRIAKSDAVVIILPEYNHSFPASVKNALDYLHKEWRHKPVGLVSYAGVSGGLRSVESLTPVLVALGMTRASNQVIIANPWQYLDESGAFVPGEAIDTAAIAMLEELAQLHPALSQLR